MKRIIRATTNPSETEREKKHKALARIIAEEGMVLLENDGSLPIRKDKKIALYGFGARHTGYGGTGSGENHPRHHVNIEEGLIAAGITVSSVSWLDDFDEEYRTGRANWKEHLTEELKKIPRMKQMDYASAHPFQPPFGREITEEDVKESDTDTAVYVLTRQAGEGADRKEEKGDWFIRDEEYGHLKFLSEHYGHLILILNIGSLMDLSFLDDIRIGAVLYAMQGGMETGNAVADLLTGKVTPSGKLSDSWAYSYEDYPCADTFSYRSGDSHIEEYREGIYVGYRWFDAKGIAVRYPFGYGKSYTEFSLTAENCRYADGTLSALIRVKNTGNVFSGKEVVQLYLSAPAVRMDKERKSLAACGKTGLLLPGAEEIVQLSFALRDSASYDEENHRFVLEKGDYLVSFGADSAHLFPLCALHLDEDLITEENDPICPVVNPFENEQIPASQNPVIPSDVPVFFVRPEDIRTEKHVYMPPAMKHNRKLDRAMSKLKKEDLLNFLCGTSYFGRVVNTVFGAGGRTTAAYYRKGIPDMPMADGPQGLNILDKNLKPHQNFISMPSLPETLTFGSVQLFSDFTIPKDDDKRTIYYQYCTAWPCETLVAQTWNAELARMEGDAVGREMEEFGVVFWLAPAMNIHRNPLCGRNYEYYSEDPVLSGKTAAAVTKGVQKHKGCFVTLKHFCCNNLEDDRNMSDSRIGERALREIYLKGFRIAVREGKAGGVMSSYNKVNGTYVSNNYDLLTKVLRNEWGFQGIVMTDWFATGHDDSKDELAAPAGCDLIMPATPLVNKRLKKAYKEGILSDEDVERAARNVINMAVHSCVIRS